MKKWVSKKLNERRKRKKEEEEEENLWPVL